MIWGREKIYLGRGGLITIIAPICMPQQGRDRMDCIGVVWMTRSINRSCHQLGTCLCSNMLLGLLGSDFHSKNMYYGRYNVFTHNLVFYVGLGRQEWMDGIGWVRMTTSQLGRCFQLGLGFASGLVGLGFSQQKNMYYSILIAILALPNSQRIQEEVDRVKWMLSYLR